LPVSLSLPLREDIYTGAPVIAVFDNLLPDNDSIRRQIAVRSHAPGIDAYSLLAALGHDCAGALQFLPVGQDPGPAGIVRGTPVNETEIGVILANLSQAPLGISEDSSFRISIAGAQERQHCCSGMAGGTNRMVQLPLHIFSSRVSVVSMLDSISPTVLKTNISVCKS